MGLLLAVLAVSVVALAIAGASWAAVRREKLGLEFLFATTQALLEARDLEAASVEVLRRASVRFGADCAELTLFPETSASAAFRTTVRAGEPVDVMRSAEDDDITLAPPIYGVVHIAEAVSDPWVTRLRGRLGVSRGLAVTLRHGSHTVGYLALGMQTSDSRESRSDDEQLQELANQVALTLERSRLHEELVRLAALQNELADRAFHDPLTQLANRVLFIDRMERALLERDPERHVVSVVSIDLDDFRRVNAERGRAAGDAVLVEVAHRLQKCLRRTDTAARLGGDEFALLLPEVLHPREAELIAQRVVEALAAPMSTDGGSVSIKASVGLACASADESGSTLLRKATAAANEAREAGSGTYRIDGGSTAVSTDADLAEELQSALNNGELVVQYQPIVELRTGIILGAEALVRWQHPVRGLIAPLDFLPVAVESGLIDRIDEYVMRTACDQLKRWQTAYPATPELAMSVNVSAGDLARGTVVDRVARCVARVHIDPSSLILEFTENAVLEDLPAAISTFDALQRVGAQVAIDDVGTGYTSLAYLRRLPIDILKIARPLVAELGDPNSSGELARTVARHAEALRLALVGEGVELPLQVKRLNELGCAMAQGYHLARPCDAEAMDALLGKGGLDPAVYGLLTTVKAAPVTVVPVAVVPVAVAPAQVARSNGAPAKAAPALALLTVAPVTVAPPNGAPAKAAPMTVAPVTVAPAQVAPSNEAPTKAAPVEVTPAAVASATVAPMMVAPPQVAPPNGAPANGAPAKAAPAVVAPVTVAPIMVAPAVVAPANGAPAKAAPAVVAPPNGAPAKAAPAVVALVTVAPIKVAPAQETPAKAAPAKTPPAKAPPAQVAPAQVAPPNGVPAKAPPAALVLPTVAPMKIVPAQVAPAKAAPTQLAPPNGVSAKAHPAAVALLTLAPVQVVRPNGAPAKAAPAGVAPMKVAPARVPPAKAPRAKVAPAKVVPPNGVPAKAPPAAVAPVTVAPMNVAPAEVALSQAAPTQVAPPSEAPPTKALPTEAPAKVAPVTVAPMKVAPASAALAPPAPAPSKAAPPKVAPTNAATVTAAPAAVTASQIAPSKAAPSQVAPTKVARAKVAPAKRTPAARTPATRTPAKIAPAKRTPAERTSAKVAAATRTPAKAPAKRTPAKRTPAKVAAVKRTTAKRTPAKAPAKRTTARRTPAKAPVKRTTPRRTPAKVAPTKQTTAKRNQAKVAAVKRTIAKRTPARAPAKRPAAKRTPAKAPVKRAAAKRTPAKVGPAKRTPAKAPAKRTTVKRSPAKVAPAKRTTVKRAPATRKPVRPQRVPSTGARTRNSA